MVSHFLFISVDYVAEYASYGVFFEKEHFFCSLCQGKYLSETPGIVRRDIFDIFYYSLDMYIISYTFRLKVFPQFLFEKFGSSSSGYKDILKEELSGNVCCGNKNAVKDDGEK